MLTDVCWMYFGWQTGQNMKKSLVPLPLPIDAPLDQWFDPHRDEATSLVSLKSSSLMSRSTGPWWVLSWQIVLGKYLQQVEFETCLPSF